MSIVHTRYMRCLYMGHLHAFILAKSWYLWTHRYIRNPLHLISNTHEHNLKHLLSYSVHNQFMCEIVSSCSIRRNGKIKACQSNFFGQHVNGDSSVSRQGFMLPLMNVLIYRVGHYWTNEFIYIVSLFLEISIFSALSLGFYRFIAPFFLFGFIKNAHKMCLLTLKMRARMCICVFCIHIRIVCCDLTITLHSIDSVFI